MLESDAWLRLHAYLALLPGRHVVYVYLGLLHVFYVDMLIYLNGPFFWSLDGGHCVS